MGCGPSKDEVATGNTVSARSLLQKKSDITSNKTSSSSSNTSQETVNRIDNGSKPVLGKAETCTMTDHSPPEAESEGVAPSTEVKIGEEGKVVSKDSPDTHSSSTKDKEAVAVTRRVGSEGAEYYSPRSEPDGGKSDADDGSERINEFGNLVVDETEASSKIENSLVSEGGKEIAPKQEEGKIKGKDSADLKEAILVEETESDAGNLEKKTVGEGEIGNDSLPH